jgi:hypothetical protein
MYYIVQENLFDKFNKVRPIRLRIYYPDLIYEF